MSTGYDRWIWESSNFPNKVSKNEDILMVVREDISIVVFKAISLYLVFLALLILKAFLSGLSQNLIYFFDSLMWSAASILVMMFALMFHNYYLSMQIITSERIIDVDQTGLLKREVNSVPLQNIQDITTKQNGFLATIFNFGNIALETSGQSPNELKSKVSGVVFNNVPHPRGVAAVLNTLLENYENRAVVNAARIEANELKKVLNPKIFGG